MEEKKLEYKRISGTQKQTVTRYFLAIITHFTIPAEYSYLKGSEETES